MSFVYRFFLQLYSSELRSARIPPPDESRIGFPAAIMQKDCFLISLLIYEVLTIHRKSGSTLLPRRRLRAPICTHYCLLCDYEHSSSKGRPVGVHEYVGARLDPKRE